MLEIDLLAPSDPETTAAPPAWRRRRAKPAPPRDAEIPQEIQAPRWAWISERGADASDAAFFAGAGLALLDQVLVAAPLRRRRPGPAGRLHRLWCLFAARSPRLDASTLAMAADLLGLTDVANFDAIAGALRDVGSNAPNPLAAAVAASATAMRLFAGTAAPEAEVFLP